MGEFLDVIRQTKRICKSVNGNCGRCLMGAFSCPNNARFDSTDEQKFIDFANAVMTWAAGHPEPVYPTWGEWLVSVGAARQIPAGIPFELANGEIVDPPWDTVVAIHDHIPADIAEKLGLQPKEG